MGEIVYECVCVWLVWRTMDARPFYVEFVHMWISITAIIVLCAVWWEMKANVPQPCCMLAVWLRNVPSVPLALHSNATQSSVGQRASRNHHFWIADRIELRWDCMMILGWHDKLIFVNRFSRINSVKQCLVSDSLLVYIDVCDLWATVSVRIKSIQFTWPWYAMSAHHWPVSFRFVFAVYRRILRK